MGSHGRCTTWPLNQSDYAYAREFRTEITSHMSFCDFIMLGIATTVMLCKVGHVAVSMLFLVLLNLKRKQTELLLCDAIAFSFGRSRRFAWSLATSAHDICASHSRILKKTALGDWITLTLLVSDLTSAHLTAFSIPITMKWPHTLITLLNCLCIESVTSFFVLELTGESWRPHKRQTSALWSDLAQASLEKLSAFTTKSGFISSALDWKMIIFAVIIRCSEGLD